MRRIQLQSGMEADVENEEGDENDRATDYYRKVLQNASERYISTSFHRNFTII
jgi:hypothetical protein